MNMNTLFKEIQITDINVVDWDNHGDGNRKLIDARSLRVDVTFNAKYNEVEYYLAVQPSDDCDVGAVSYTLCLYDIDSELQDAIESSVKDIDFDLFANLMVKKIGARKLRDAFISENFKIVGDDAHLSYNANSDRRIFLQN